ncbi:hypothetical protein ROR02_11430 [Pararhodospirillum oryzae]|uniref:histidine kinase n=1 Tax=Pararhodospirillum oryzae TaxID=478448 RepID=A0A512H6E8_9PROT|nr:hypothetical protein ROR02_11430 [Pararhodospirillum oryzae]
MGCLLSAGARKDGCPLEPVIDAGGSALAVKDRAFVYRYVSPALAGLLGRPASRVVGTTDFSLYDRRRALISRREDLCVLTERRPLQCDGLVMTPDGPRWLSQRKDPVFFLDHCVGVRVCLHDTGNVEVVRLPPFVPPPDGRPAAPRPQDLPPPLEDRFEKIFRSNDTLMVITDPENGRVIDANAAFVKALGATRADLLGRTTIELGFFHSEPHRRQFVQKLLDGEGRSRHQVRFPNRHGTIVVGEVTAELIPNGTSRLLLTMVNDISRRHALMAALESQARRLESIIEGTEVGTWEWHLPTGDITLNRYWTAGLGYLLEELTPFSYDTWRAMVHPDDLPVALAALERHFRDPKVRYEAEFRMRHKSGGWVWILDRGKVVEWDHENRAVRMAGTHLDLTERKRTEERLRLSEADLMRSNADLEQFATVISHDLRQPLRMIASYAQLLERRLGPRLDSEGREFLDIIHEGAARMDQMLLSLLEYSRAGRATAPPASLDSRALVEEALHFLGPVITEAEAHIRIAGVWPLITGRRDDLVRLFQNLVGNAIKYRLPDRPPDILIQGRLTPPWWEITIDDNGRGFAPTEINSLFTLFQRLHPESGCDGFGIGLATCRRIVERHCGTIEVTSAGPGQGSRFTVRLPIGGCAKHRN